MATMALSQPRWLKCYNQGVDPWRRGGSMEDYFIEDASQTYVVGDFVYINGDGEVAIATNTSSQLDSAIGGLAEKAATGTTGEVAEFLAIRPSDILVMNVFHSTPASSVTAQNQLTDVFGIILEDSVWCVDIENTTVEDGSTALARCQVVGFPKGYFPNTDGKLVESAIGDTNGKVLVKILPFSIAGDGTPFTRILQFG